MKLLKDYKAFIGTLILVGVMLFVVLRWDDWYNTVDHLIESVLPLFLGVLIAYVLNIIVVTFERYYFPNSKKRWIQQSRRSVCVAASIISVLLVIIFIMRLVIPQTLSSLSLVVHATPMLYQSLQEWSTNSLHSFPLLEEYLFTSNFSVQELFNESMAYITKGLSNTLSLVGNVVGQLIKWSIGFIFAIYILLNKETLLHQLKIMGRAYLSPLWINRIGYVVRVSDATFRNFFVGQFVDALILGLMVTVGMLVLHIPYATNIGSVIGLTSLIPIVGAYLGGLIGLLMLATTSAWNVGGFLIILIVMQQIEGNFVYPKIVGNSVGLPGIWVFAAISVGAALYGIMGVLLSVPFAATVYKILRDDVRNRLSQ